MSTASDKEPHMPRNHDSPARPRELAKEQSLSELEQEMCIRDRHESLLYPADGVVIIPPHDPRARA